MTVDVSKYAIDAEPTGVDVSKYLLPEDETTPSGTEGWLKTLGNLPENRAQKGKLKPYSDLYKEGINNAVKSYLPILGSQTGPMQHNPAIEEVLKVAFAPKTTAQEAAPDNALSDLISTGTGILPYTVPAVGQLKFLKDIADNPRMLPEMLKSVRQTNKDIHSIAPYFFPALTDSNDLQNSGAGERLTTKPFSNAMNVMLPAGLAAGAVEGIPRISRKLKVKPLEVKPKVDVSKYVEPEGVPNAVKEGIVPENNLSEYQGINQGRTLAETGGGNRGEVGGQVQVPQEGQVKPLNLERRAAVEIALQKGLPLPEEVLAEYPDLVAKYKKRSKPSKAIPVEGTNLPSTIEGIPRPESIVDRLGEESTFYTNNPADVARLAEEKRAQYRAADEAKKLEANPLPTKPLVANEPPVGESQVPALPDKTVVPEGGTTLGFAGTNPEVMKKTITDVTNLTTNLVKQARSQIRIDPSVAGSVEKGLKAMEEHHKNIRDAEFVSHELERTFKGLVPDEKRQLLILHSLEQERSLKYLGQLTPSERGVLSWLEGETQKLEQYVRDNKVLDIPEKKEGIRYLFHWWENPKTGEPYKGKYGKFARSLPQAKQRVINTYEQGMTEVGLRPVTTNVGRILGESWQSVVRANEARRMVKTIYGLKGDPEVSIQRLKGGPVKQIRLIERWDKLAGQGLTDDYVRFDNPMFDKGIMTENGHIIKGAIGVQKELYPFFKAYTESPEYGKAAELMFAAKSLKLSMSFFHHVSLGMQELANGRIPFKNVPRGVRLMRAPEETMQLLHREGLDIYKGYEDINYNKAITFGGSVGKAVFAPIRIMNKFLFETIQPGMKASFAYDEFNKLWPKYQKKGLSKEQCARDVVKAADNFFSGEDYKRALLESGKMTAKIYFGASSRKKWQMALISPTWQREHMLTAKNIAKSFVPDEMLKKMGLDEMGPSRAIYQKYLAGALTLYAASNLYNWINTKKMDGEGKMMWNNPEEKGFGVRLPWNEPAYTTTNREGEITKHPERPAYFRPLKSAFEVAEFATNPLKKAVGKLTPVFSETARLIDKIGSGEKISVPNELKDWGLEVVTPMSFSQFGQAYEGKRRVGSAIMPLFGMPTSALRDKEVTNPIYEAVAQGKMTREQATQKLKSLGVDYHSAGLTAARERLGMEKKPTGSGKLKTVKTVKKVKRVRLLK